MTLPLLAGGFTAALVVLLAWWWRGAPTRASCPRCGEETSAVRRSDASAVGEAVVRRRWCTACGWTGLGRAGPEWTPGQPSAHDSGFHWGEGRFPRDFGFHFARRPDDDDPAEPDEPAPGPPDHPSGFRFSRDGEDGSVTWAFRWGDAAATAEGRPGGADAAADADPGGGAAPPTTAEQRPGFRWGTPGRSDGGVHGFRWKQDEG